MSNLLIVLIYASLTLINIVLMVPVVLKKQKSQIDRVYTAICSLIILWLLIDIATYSIPNEGVILFLHGARYVPMSIIPVFFFNLVILYYNYSDNRFFSVVKIVFFVFASIISIIALTSSFHDVLWIGNVTIATTTPLLIFHEDIAPGYGIAALISQIPIMVVAVVVIMKRRKLPKEYRSSTTILLCCLIIYFFTVIIFASGSLKDTGIDASLIGVCIINFFLYLAFISKERTDYLNVWLGDIFNFLDEGILIVNQKGLVVESNSEAERIFNSIGIKPKGMYTENIWKRVNQIENADIRMLEDESSSTTMSRDLYLKDGEYPVIYEIDVEPFMSDIEEDTGEYLIMTEVTRNRLYIERLQDLAGIDSLTGLMNRYGYEKILHEWDREENLPLTLIIGDVNDLKDFNDQWGHKAGDELLEKVAQVLVQSCPSEGVVARIGGDEFIMILKNHDEEKTVQVIEDIAKGIEQQDNRARRLSVALGSATKQNVAENINALYAEADQRMYENKKVGKACND